MATPKKPLDDRTEGPSMVKKGSRSENMTFSPKIIVTQDGRRQYTCFAEIYSQANNKAGTEISIEWRSSDIEQFKQALTTVFLQLSALAKECYLSDTFTIGLTSLDGEETEVYAPKVLKPGVYSLSEAQEE